eukprot:366117-Chlamydomonas_euryale.AAC.11
MTRGWKFKSSVPHSNRQPAHGQLCLGCHSASWKTTSYRILLCRWTRDATARSWTTDPELPDGSGAPDCTPSTASMVPIGRPGRTRCRMADGPGTLHARGQTRFAAGAEQSAARRPGQSCGMPGAFSLSRHRGQERGGVCTRCHGQ